MSSKELIRKILLRLNKYKWLVFIGAFGFAILMYLYAKTIPTIYSVKSSLYPLSAAPDKSASSKLNELIGAGGSTKSLSDDANVNIEEVAKSRKTRYAVVAERLPQYHNKYIAEILINEYNKHVGRFGKKIQTSAIDSALISVGANLIKENYVVKFNKNNLLEISFSSTDPNILVPVSNVLASKITEFYKELKIKKAKFDFDFTQVKVDSLQTVLKYYDKRRIILNNTTLFVPSGKLEYILPQENLENDKLLVLSQRNGAQANREDALWRLQKVTPIIEMLDKPEAPFDEVTPPKKLYAAGGFMIGLIFCSFLLVYGLLYKYVTQQINTAINSTFEEDNTSTTAPISTITTTTTS